MGKPFIRTSGHTNLFNVPNIVGKQYRPGRQPYSPGESQIDSGNPHFSPIPWPNIVPSVIALANSPGVPRTRALQIANNSGAPGLTNYLFIAGFAGKSRQ